MRSAKTFTERTYSHAIVFLVRCPSCESLHTIADQLGRFSDVDDSNHRNGDDTCSDGQSKKKGWDVEMFMKSIGKQEDNIKVVTGGEHNDHVLEVTLEDMLRETVIINLNEEGDGHHKK